MFISHIYDAAGRLMSGMAEDGPSSDPDPKGFDAGKLQVNQIRLRDGSLLAKIPNIENRIFFRHQEDRDKVYVELITGRTYDREKKQTRTRKMIIGTVSATYPGMMIANGNYEDCFDTLGNLFNDPMITEVDPETEPTEEETDHEPETEEKTSPEEKPTEETGPEEPTKETNTEEPEEERNPEEQTEETTKKSPQPAKQEPSPQSSTKKVKTETRPSPSSPGGDTRTVDEIRESLLKKEQQLNEKMEQARFLRDKCLETQKELDHMIAVRTIQLQEAETDHIKLLDHILDYYRDIVRDQSKRKPEAPMSLKQIRIINDLLSELRDYFAGCETEDYLHLAEEPDKESENPGTTYGEMALLLTAYATTLDAFLYRTLYLKPQQS